MGTLVSHNTKREFLAVLSETGNVLETCRRTGVNRATAYHWRGDADFDQMWEEALQIRRDTIRDEVVSKALAATGHIVQEVMLDEQGQPVLDENFEHVVKSKLVDYDSQVLRTMLNKFVASADGAPVTAVQVNNHVNTQLAATPRLVRPEGMEVIDAGLDFEEVE